MLLSAVPAEARTRRFALAVAFASLAVFLALAPFAAMPMARLNTFIPANQAVLIVNDMITATLLFGQLRVTRSRSLLVLACGYVYTATLTLVHLLTYPGVFAPNGLLGAGSQTTAYLFVFWHSGFPVFVMAYALMSGRQAEASARQPLPIARALVAVIALVAAITILTVAGNDLFPPILNGSHYSSAFNIGRHGQWVITALAAVVLWRRKPHSVLDLWVLVALCAWCAEIALVAIFNSGRYDLGFYTGRIYGVLASCTLLVALLTEQSKLYAKAFEAQERAAAEASLRENREVLRLAMQGGRMGAWSRDLMQDRLWWSHELEEIFGLPPGGFSGTHHEFVQMVHPDDRTALRSAVNHAIERHEDYAVEFRFRHASGEWRWMDGRGRAVYDASGRPHMLFGIGIDITARKRGEQAAQEIEARFQTMADGISQLAWMARPDGWIYWFNKRWYEYTGTTPEAMSGWGWQSVHDPDVLPAVMTQWQRSIATGEPFEMVFPLRGADGRFRPFLTRGSPLLDEEGRVRHWFGTNTDITVQREAEEALRTADRRKDEFLATLAHELRNPLAPIRNAVEIMRRVAPLPEPAAWARDVVDRQSQHVAQLVDDLLEVSRITHGKLHLRKARISLLDPVRDAVEEVRPKLEAAGHTLAVEVPDDPLPVDADPTRVTQIFVNLLNNAAKFTPACGRISVSAARVDGHAVVRVCDTGIGIDAADLPVIFNMFSQVTPAIERTDGGLGIGLALVRGLVELHGGSVEAASAGPGKGSEFSVRFPLADTVSLQPRTAVEANPQAVFVRRRIVVADDNVDAAASLRMLLELAGHEVREVHDGREAVDATLEFHPDIVLLDIGMPRLNGYEAARAIRGYVNSHRVRIVALTGWGQEHDKHKARDAGFDAHITKPVDPTMLEVMLQQ